jgi:hypothetical protein
LIDRRKETTAMRCNHHPAAARNPRRRGTAMMEMVLALPLILLILALLLFFGKGIMRVQHSQVADRYEAWRLAEEAPGPTADGMQIGQTFLKGAETITSDTNGFFPPDAGDNLILAGGRISTDTQSLTAQALTDFPNGRQARFNTTYANTVPALQRFQGAITHQHTRIGNDWKFVNGWREFNSEWIQKANGDDPWMLQPVDEYFYTDLDARLTPLIEMPNALASGAAALYTAKPGYKGPTVTFP